MTLITVDEAQARIGTPLDAGYLAALIDDVEAEVTEVIGDPTAAITETHAGYTQSLYVNRKIGSVTTITEYTALDDVTGTALTENEDFFIWANEGRIQRIGAKWGAKVTLVYVPVDDTNKRRSVIVDLIKYYLAYSPLKQENIVSEYAFTAPENWEEEKARLIQRLRFTAV